MINQLKDHDEPLHYSRTSQNKRRNFWIVSKEFVIISEIANVKEQRQWRLN